MEGLWLRIVSDGVLRRDGVAGPPADAQLMITGNHRGKAQLPQSSRPSHGLQQTQRGHDVQGPLCTCTRHQNLFPQPSCARCPDAVLAPSCPCAVPDAVPGQLSCTLSRTHCHWEEHSQDTSPRLAYINTVRQVMLFQDGTWRRA